MAATVGALTRRGISSSRILLGEIESASATAGGHGGGWKLWRNLSFFVGLPAVGICMANAYIAHQNEHHDPPEFVKYEHMRLRTKPDDDVFASKWLAPGTRLASDNGFLQKKYPWGDGNHSLFHNPHANALPDGYEEVHH